MQTTPRILGALTLALVLISGAARAQQKSTRPGGLTAPPPPTRPVLGVIDGSVSDTNLAPVPLADVTVFRTTGRVKTNVRGRFRFIDVPAGQYLLIVRRIGYRPVSGIIDVPAGDTVRLAYTMEPVAQTLGAVVVTEQRHSFRMQEFYDRAKGGFGEFYTQEQIESRNSLTLTDLLKFSKTMSITTDNTSGHQIALSRREGGSLTGVGAGYCPMQVMLDGAPLPTGFPMELLPSPKEVAGIEVYSGPATVPMKFAGPDRRCGMVLIWTKDGY